MTAEPATGFAAEYPATGFAEDNEVADCTAVIITYHSAADLPGLLDSLPTAAAGLRVRVVVVDNDSADDIRQVVSAYPGVRLVAAGGNLGYSGGINVGRRHLGRTRAVAILNPDLRLAPSCLHHLLDAFDEPGVGVAVPRFLDERGELSPSLRREPTLLRALGDALLGRRWPGRPRWLSEMVWTPAAYRSPASVDWSTGAALVVSREVDTAIGAWDDGRFFMYCEETDYLRRAREAGWTVRYVPDAVVTHRGGGSGTSPDLVALGTVNRVWYYRKYHRRAASAAFRAVVVLHELLRAHRPGNRRALHTVLLQRRWSALPGHRPDLGKGPA